MRILLLFAACLPLVAASQVSKETACRSELANRGFGTEVDRVTTRDNRVRGLVRSGQNVLEFQCDVDNSGNVTEVRVDRVGQADPQPERNAQLYKRGYSDGYRGFPRNNNDRDDAYERGYDEGRRDRYRR